MNFTPPERPGLPQRRKLLWLVFWFVLLATPVLVVAVPVLLKNAPALRMSRAVEMLSCLGSLGAGASVSGFLLARLTNEDVGGFIRQGVGYSMAFTLLHLMTVVALWSLLV